MEDVSYKYRLLKGSKKYICPSCGQKTFVPFVETSTNEILEEYGRCDRQNNCTYFVSPGMQDEPIFQPEPVQKEIKYVDPAIVEKTLKAYDNNSFVMWLANILGNKDFALKLAYKWKIGTTKDGHAIFWQMDSQKVFNGHVMAYVDGHRDKDNKYGNRFLFQTSKGYETQIYGLHLIDSSKPCAIVESEKTAVLASIYWPKYNWLASQRNTLKTEYLNKLKGHVVYLFPDADKAGRQGYKKASENLTIRLIKNRIIDSFENRSDGYDLADYIEDDLKQSQIPGESNILGYPIYWQTQAL